MINDGLGEDTLSAATPIPRTGEVVLYNNRICRVLGVSQTDGHADLETIHDHQRHRAPITAIEPLPLHAPKNAHRPT